MPYLCGRMAKRFAHFLLLVLLSLPMVAQTEVDGRRLSDGGVELPSMRGQLLMTDSMRLPQSVMHVERPVPQMPTVPNFTQLTKQGATGWQLWNGATLGFYGATSQMPGLMTMETGTAAVSQNLGRWHLTASATVDKYWMPWQHTLRAQYGVGGTVGYDLSEAVTLHAFGYYYANRLQVGPAMSPYVNATTYGGYADVRFSKAFGANMGVRRYMSPISGKWMTEPIVSPYVKIGGGKLELPLGGLLKQLIWGNQDDPMRFRPHPMSRPPVKK